MLAGAARAEQWQRGPEQPEPEQWPAAGAGEPAQWQSSRSRCRRSRSRAELQPELEQAQLEQPEPEQAGPEQVDGAGGVYTAGPSPPAFLPSQLMLRF